MPGLDGPVAGVGIGATAAHTPEQCPDDPG